MCRWNWTGRHPGVWGDQGRRPEPDVTDEAVSPQRAFASVIQPGGIVTEKPDETPARSVLEHGRRMLA